MITSYRVELLARDDLPQTYGTRSFDRARHDEIEKFNSGRRFHPATFGEETIDFPGALTQKLGNLVSPSSAKGEI